MLSSCGCDDVVLCVDNNDIQHNCEKLVQLFEKFVVMAVNPGVDVDTHFVHPWQSRWLLCSNLYCIYLQVGALLRCHLPCAEISYPLVGQHRRNLRIPSWMSCWMKQTRRATCLLCPRKCTSCAQAGNWIGLDCRKPSSTASSKVHTNTQEQPANTMSFNAAMLSATISEKSRVPEKMSHCWRTGGRPSSCANNSYQEPNWNRQKITETRWHLKIDFVNGQTPWWKNCRPCARSREFVEALETPADHGATCTVRRNV